MYMMLLHRPDTVIVRFLTKHVITGHLKVIIMAQEPTNLLVTETILNITETLSGQNFVQKNILHRIDYICLDIFF